MKAGYNLEQLLEKARGQSEAKVDVVANTEHAVRIVEMPGFADDLALVIKRTDGDVGVERFEITEHTHQQIAARLEISRPYYRKMLADHHDLLLTNVNTLLEREPANRLVRLLDGTARAFLSDQYRRTDNDMIIQNTLPAILDRGDEVTVLNSNLSDEGALDLKVLFTGDELAQDVGPTALEGAPDIVRPGFHLGNNEIGGGRSFVRGFFFRSYCLNGCVWGKDGQFEFNRVHRGAKLTAGADLVVRSERTTRLEDSAIASQMTDIINSVASPEFGAQMADSIRVAKGREPVKSPEAAVAKLAKDHGLCDWERSEALRNLIEDRDLSQWGATNAITKVANSDAVSYERATELEEIGRDILALTSRQWTQTADKVLQAA